VNDARSILDPELARRVAALTLRARKSVEGLLTGMHKSPHRGASVVFVEHREYKPGDDPRLLDWRAYARTDRHSIKRFEQETQLHASLVLDRSGSMGYGTDPSKIEHAATLLAAVGYLLVQQGDAAGAMIIDDHVDHMIKPRSSATHLDELLRTLAAPAQQGQSTDLSNALRQVAERSGRRGVVVVASDLLDLSEQALQPLANLVARGNEVVVLQVLHPDELELPFEGPTRFLGLEGEDPVEADADAVREGYLREIHRFLETSRRHCVTAGARYALARTDRPAEHTLAELFAAQRSGWG
jgi:uncharacterized protein (DUF58 family)